MPIIQCFFSFCAHENSRSDRPTDHPINLRHIHFHLIGGEKKKQLIMKCERNVKGIEKLKQEKNNRKKKNVKRTEICWIMNFTFPAFVTRMYYFIKNESDFCSIRAQFSNNLKMMLSSAGFCNSKFYSYKEKSNKRRNKYELMTFFWEMKTPGDGFAFHLAISVLGAFHFANAAKLHTVWMHCIRFTNAQRWVNA